MAAAVLPLNGSIDRVRAVIRGEMPDRAPLYDLLRNDAVISHFAGQELSVENAPDVVYRAYDPCLDATRPAIRLPDHVRIETLTDGRKRHFFRWTAWTEPVVYTDSVTYEQAKRQWIKTCDLSWNAQKQEEMRQTMAWIASERARLGEVFFFPGMAGPGLCGIFDEVGLESFSYYLADCPDLFPELLEYQTLMALARIEHLPENHGIEAIITFDDIAFKSGLLLPPKWLAAHYFPRFARIMAAYHRRGIKVLFHSDGNLNPILDGLVEAGIDGLNPIEVLAGMDVSEIHRRHPHLFMAGAIDVSQLLPFGKPDEIKDAVRRTLDAAEGRIMIGSTTELNNEVPLTNYLALREAVLNTPFTR